MLRTIPFALMFGWLGLCSGAPTCPSSPSLDTFLCTANEEYRTLQLIGEISILTGAPVQDTKGSIDDAIQQIKPLLAKERTAVFFSTKAGDVLNEFYLYWVTIINDADPRTYEGLFDYQKRTDERYTTLQEKASHLRLAIE